MFLIMSLKTYFKNQFQIIILEHSLKCFYFIQLKNLKDHIHIYIHNLDKTYDPKITLEYL